MYKAYCRTYQSAYRLAVRFLPWREPLLLKGEGCSDQLPALLQEKGLTNVLVVTDLGIKRSGLLDELLAGLTEKDIQHTVYDKTVPNPSTTNIEEALALYNSAGAVGLVAIGGGSPIDCAKGVAARLARPEKSLREMKGQLKVRKPIPLLVAVPTTSGTGSEATIAAVISEKESHEKYAIIDPALTPHIAILDPLLTRGLPPALTAATGMDALTHAVEAYIGQSNTKETREWSREATRLIFRNLGKAYDDGENMTARAYMLDASYLAGRAFTRAYVGYVHALAHALGGFYDIPHGFANAVILPHVLDYYGDCIYRSLAELADAAGISASCDSEETKAKSFIEAVSLLNEKMGIPETIDGIQEADIPLLVEHAHSEANPLYPVPRILRRADLQNLLERIKK